MKVDIWVLISTTLTMLILICIGYFSAKKGLLDEKFSKKLSSLIVYICQPALLVGSLMNVGYSKEMLVKGGMIVLLSAGVHLMNVLVALGFSAPIKDINERTVISYSVTFSNCAFFGFPVLKSVFGDEGVFWGSFYCIVFNILVWTWGMFTLSRANREIKMNPRKMFVNFGTVPCAIGIVLYITQMSDKLPKPITLSLDYLSGLCTPISMLIIGALLARLPLKKVFFSPKSYYLCLVKLVILPAIVAIVLALAGLSKDLVCFGALMAGFPVAATSSAFSEKYSIAPEFSSVCVGLSTILSVATVPIIVTAIDKLV